MLFCFVFPAYSNADPLKDAKTAYDSEDYEEAYELLSPLAEAENAEAQTMLGVMYINGQGVEMDPAKGLRLISLNVKPKVLVGSRSYSLWVLDQTEYPAAS